MEQTTDTFGGQAFSAPGEPAMATMSEAPIMVASTETDAPHAPQGGELGAQEHLPAPAPIPAPTVVPTPVVVAPSDAALPTPVIAQMGEKTMSEDNSYLATLGRIEELRRQAEEQKKSELTPTIERFKRAIQVYGISPLDVFSMDQLASVMHTPEPVVVHAAHVPHVAHVAHVAKAPTVQHLAQQPVRQMERAIPPQAGGKVVKYTDGKGGTWTGYGRKPQWFIDAVARGVNPQDLLAPGQMQDRILRTPTFAQPQATHNHAQQINPGSVAGRAPAGQNPPKYADGKGGTWTGYGRKPQWFIDAVAQGINPQNFLISAQGDSSASGGAALMDRQRAIRQSSPVLEAGKKKGYKLGEHYWTGVGPRPKWFKEAIGSGRSLEELRA